MSSKKPTWIVFNELSGGTPDGSRSACLRDYVNDIAQEHEEEIARYLETAPSYSAMGKVVGDVLDPGANVVLFPGKRTDGVFVWPAEIAYYVRRYHLRLPNELVERMASLNWQPPTDEQIDWKQLGMTK